MTYPVLRKLSLRSFLFDSIDPNVDFLVIEGDMALDLGTLCGRCLEPPNEALLTTRREIDIEINGVALNDTAIRIYL